MTVIHEGAHFLAALALGVPFTEIQIGFIRGNPGITLPERFIDAPLSIYHYVGGLSAAIVLACLYFLLWFRGYRRSPSIFVWCLGLVTITFTGLQLGYGIVEGRFHVAYVYYASSPSSITNIMLVIFGVLGFLIHFLIYQLPKRKNGE